MAGILRRIGALALTLGMALSIVALWTGGPASAAAGAVSVCNNQKNDPSVDCVGDNLHGTVTASYDADGNLQFALDAADGFAGWTEIYICMPSSGPTKSADCQGSTAGVLSPANGDFSVAGVSDPSVGDKSISFSCDDAFTATVPKTVLAAFSTPVSWTVHVNSCAGSTDEAFGSSSPSPAGDQGTPAPGQGTPASGQGTPPAAAGVVTEQSSGSGATVLGEQIVREVVAPADAPAAPAAAQVEAAELAATGPVAIHQLVIVAFGLLVAGWSLVLTQRMRRPAGRHYIGS